MSRFCVYVDEKWCRRIDIDSPTREQARREGAHAAEVLSSKLSRKSSDFPEAYFEVVEVIETSVIEWDENEHGVWAGGE